MNDRKLTQIIWDVQNCAFDAESHLLDRKYVEVADAIQEGLRKLQDAQTVLEAWCEEYDTRDSLGSGLPDGVSGD